MANWTLNHLGHWLWARLAGRLGRPATRRRLLADALQLGDPERVRLALVVARPGEVDPLVTQAVTGWVAERDVSAVQRATRDGRWWLAHATLADLEGRLPAERRGRLHAELTRVEHASEDFEPLTQSLEAQQTARVWGRRRDRRWYGELRDLLASLDPDRRGLRWRGAPADPEAVVAWRPSWAATCPTVFVDVLRPEPGTAAWVAEVCVALRDRVGEWPEVWAPPERGAVSDALLAAGFGLRAVSLEGDLATARAAVDAHLAGRARPAGPLRWRRAVGADLGHLIRLRLDLDHAADRGWADTPPMLAGGLLSLVDRAGENWVLADADGIPRGYAHHGRSLDEAGLEVVLAPAARGRGHLWSAYRLLLDGMARAGTRRFSGITHQPAVLHAARVMGRRPVALLFGAPAGLPFDHFDEVLAAD